MKESDSWVEGSLVGFEIKGNKQNFSKQNIEEKFKRIKILSDEVYSSSATAILHYDTWLIVEIKEKGMKQKFRWYFYEKEFTVIKPSKEPPVKSKPKEIYSTEKTSRKAQSSRQKSLSSKKFKEMQQKIVQESGTTQNISPLLSTKKRKREKQEPIVKGPDFDVLKQTSYLLKRTIEGKERDEIHKILEKFDLVHPDKVVRLLKFINMSQSEAFKKACDDYPDKISGTSFYCFLAYRDLQRNTVIDAGKMLSQWYRNYIKNTGKSIEEYEKENLPRPPTPPPPVFVPKKKPRLMSIQKESLNYKTPKSNNIAPLFFRSTKKDKDFENLDFGKWRYTHIRRSSSEPALFDVVLLLVSRPSVTISLGVYTSYELAEKAGRRGVIEAQSYVEARSKGMNGANITPSKALRTDKKSILKNLKRVIPGRLRRALGQAEPTSSSNKSVFKTPNTKVQKLVEPPVEVELTEDSVGSASGMTLRKKKINKQNFSLFNTVTPTNLDLERVSSVNSSLGNNFFPSGRKQLRKNVISVRSSYGHQEKERNSLINWHSEGFMSGNMLYYTSFSFIDDPNTVYKLLDYVLVARHEREEERSDTKKRFSFSIGQIEAIFVPHATRDTVPKARISWFYWPEETKLSAEDIKKHARCSIEGVTEIYSSNDVENHHLTTIVSKVRVLSVNEIEKSIREKLIKQEELFERKLREPFDIPLHEMSDEQKALIINVDELHLRSKRKLLRTYFRDTSSCETKMIVCCSTHYDSRFNSIVGRTHPKRKENNGEDPFIAPFVKLSLKYLDLSDLFSAKDYEKAIRFYSHSVIDSDFINSTQIHRDKLKNKQRYEILLKQKRKVTLSLLAESICCRFCFASVSFKVHGKCKVCTNCVICAKCILERRQGAVKASEDGIEFIHRTYHPYVVIQPELDISCPELGTTMLKQFLVSEGIEVESLEYIPISIVRGPVPRVIRGVGIRYLFGVKIKVELPGKQKTSVLTVCSRHYGRTVEEAKGLAGFEALSQLLGINTKYDVCVFPYKGTEVLNLSAMDSMNLLQSIERSGMSWESGIFHLRRKNLTSIELKEFYNQILLPAFYNNTECKEFKRLDRVTQIALRQKYESPNFFPSAEKNQVNQLIEDAVLWGKSIKKFFLRRSKLGKINKRGLSFAVVDKTTVFQTSPNSFGPFLTSNTMELTKNHNILKEMIKRTSWKSSTSQNIVTIILDLQQVLHSEQQINSVNKILVKNSTVKANFDIYKKNGSGCEICKQNDNPASILLCDGCDAEYHLRCLKDGRPSSGGKFFCRDCIDDRSYLYDHASLGKAGKTLAEFADRTIFSSLAHVEEFMKFDFTLNADTEDNLEAIEKLKKKFVSNSLLNAADVKAFVRFASLKGLSLPLIEKEWEDNETILRAATKKAISEGWGKQANGQDEEDIFNLQKRKDKNGVVLEVDKDLMVSSDWATRHFANKRVETLHVTTKALSQALGEVTEQRDLLLSVVKYLLDERKNKSLQ